VPKPFIYIGLTLLILAMIPPALIARARSRHTEARRIHFIQDMDNQSKFRAQQENPLFEDGRAMRPPVEGTVARGELRANTHFEFGVVNGEWATMYPPEAPLSFELVERGRERFGIYCTPCHGQAAYGDGIVHLRAMRLVNDPSIRTGTTWVQPKNLHEPEIRIQPPGQIFNTITHGIRTMSGYAAQVPTRDRWAIAAYVKSLQRSQNAPREDLSPAERDRLEQQPAIDLRPKETPQ